MLAFVLGHRPDALYGFAPRSPAICRRYVWAAALHSPSISHLDRAARCSCRRPGFPPPPGRFFLRKGYAAAKRKRLISDASLCLACCFDIS